MWMRKLVVTLMALGLMPTLGHADEAPETKKSDLQAILGDYARRPGAQVTTDSATGKITSVVLNGVTMRRYNDTLMSAEDHSSAGPVLCHQRIAVRIKAMLEVCTPERTDLIEVYSQAISKINKFTADNIALPPPGFKEALDNSVEKGITAFKDKYAKMPKEEVSKACSSVNFKDALSQANDYIGKVRDNMDNLPIRLAQVDV